MTWPELQAILGEHDQWIPLDPPLPHLLSVRDVLDHAVSGPRRHGFGPARDHVLGLKVLMADGEIVRTGGKVVKNVAGYDLTRMFVGARGSLGVIIEATFKTLPKPESERFTQARFQSLEQVDDLLAGLAESELNPSVLDVHNVPPAGEGTGYWIVIGFSGAREDVDEQIAQARALGLSRETDLAHEARFWNDAPAGGVRTISILPSDLKTKLLELEPDFFVARGANGIVHYLGRELPAEKNEAAFLSDRIKRTFDPGNKFG